MLASSNHFNHTSAFLSSQDTIWLCYINRIISPRRNTRAGLYVVLFAALIDWLRVWLIFSTLHLASNIIETKESLTAMNWRGREDRSPDGQQPWWRAAMVTNLISEHAATLLQRQRMSKSKGTLYYYYYHHHHYHHQMCHHHHIILKSI